MVSKTMAVGLIVFIVGIILAFLGNAAIIPFFISNGDTINYNEDLNLNGDVHTDNNLLAVAGSSLPLLPSTKAIIVVDIEADSNFKIIIIYNGGEYTNMPVLEKSYSSGGLKRIELLLSPQATAAASYRLGIRVENTGDQQVTVVRAQGGILSMLLGVYLFIFIAIIGLVVAVIGWFKSRSAFVPKGKPSKVDWEPTLEWGSVQKQKKSRPGLPSRKKKSTSAPVKKKKKVPAGGGGTQVECKFCGRKVDRNAYFCPHCYGKLR